MNVATNGDIMDPSIWGQLVAQPWEDLECLERQGSLDEIQHLEYPLQVNVMNAHVIEKMIGKLRDKFMY